MASERMSLFGREGLTGNILHLAVSLGALALGISFLRKAIHPEKKSEDKKK